MTSKAVMRKLVQTLAVLLMEELKTILLNMCKDRKKRRIWVRQTILRRHRLGAPDTLPKELAIEDTEGYRIHLRMSEEKFNELLLKVQDSIKKQDTVMRQAISPKLKLQVTLRYLATGDSFSTLASVYGVPKNTISKFLLEVCTAIYDALEDFIKVPQTEDEWKKIQKEYNFQWNFPNCCGAIDGKHIVIRNAPRNGSKYFNYKGTYSVILFAFVDANCCFRYFNVCTNGRANDAAVFAKSSLNAALEHVNGLNFPKGGLLVADDAFPLRNNVLKPFGKSTNLSRKQKIFNYRLSRPRRIVENAFGILVSRFRVFERPIAVGINKVDGIIKAALVLHNWLKVSSGERYTPAGSVDTEDLNTRSIIPGSWRTQNTQVNGILNLQVDLRSPSCTTSAYNVRDEYADYFSGQGAVPWQLDMIHDDKQLQVNVKLM